MSAIAEVGPQLECRLMAQVRLCQGIWAGSASGHLLKALRAFQPFAIKFAMPQTSRSVMSENSGATDNTMEIVCQIACGDNLVETSAAVQPKVRQAARFLPLRSLDRHTCKLQRDIRLRAATHITYIAQ
jgi:hypothetical protein